MAHNPTVVLRVDASATIGIGHLSRCMTLADALTETGARCTFATATRWNSVMVARLAERGHELVQLHPTGGGPAPGEDGGAHAMWLPHGWRADAQAVREMLVDRGRPDWLIVDHYALDARWESELRRECRALMVIDDLADRPHDADVLLDQNARPDGEQRYRALVADSCTVLAGPRFALLRPDFARLRALMPRDPEQPDEVRTLLVMFGGADERDLTGTVLEALGRTSFRGRTEVVVGPLHPDPGGLRRRIDALASTSLHVAPPDPAAVMASADAAIGSPGVTSYERATLGLPTLSISIADNQEPLGRWLAELGVHTDAGRAEDLDMDRLVGMIERFVHDAELLAGQRLAASRLCDGRGTERVREVLVAHGADDVPTSCGRAACE